jgi:hypothetical protein
MTTEYLQFKAEVEKQRRVVARKQALVKKQQDVLDEMLSKCPHEEVEMKSSYFSGSYYDKAYTTKWYQCTLCQERGPETIEMHSYYG